MHILYVLVVIHIYLTSTKVFFKRLSLQQNYTFELQLFHINGIFTLPFIGKKKKNNNSSSYNCCIPFFKCIIYV